MIRSAVLLGLVFLLDAVEGAFAYDLFSRYKDPYDAYMPLVMITAVCGLFQLLFIGMGLFNRQRAIPKSAKIVLGIHGVFTIAWFGLLNSGVVYEFLK